MKSLLARIGLPKAIGLYVEDDSVTLTQVVSTPVGPIETARHSEKVGPEEMAVVVRRLVQSQLGAGRTHRVPVAISLPIERTYFATRPIQSAASDPSPRVLLREALRSPSISVDEMAVDVIKARPDRRPVASIVSCETKYVSALLEALQECGIRPYRIEPMPCALLRCAARRHRARRNAKVVLRLFLGKTHFLALLVVRNLPIVWRFARFPRGDEAAAIISASRSLLAVSKDCGIESGLDVIMIHGRPDLMRLVDVDWVAQQIGASVTWFRDPPLDRSQVAFGLALGCLSREEEDAFDLAHALRPRPSLWEIFPWRQAALQVALLVCMALFLADRCRALSEQRTAVETQNTQHLWLASVTDAQLEQEKQDLTQRVATIHKFLESRIPWTTYEREIAGCLPDSVFLTAFQGDCELEHSGHRRSKGKPKKSLVIRGSLSLPEDGSVPEEIDLLLDTLRAHPLLRRDFPIVELTDLKQSQRRDGDTPMASFTIVCSPKSGKAAPQ